MRFYSAIKFRTSTCSSFTGNTRLHQTSQQHHQKQHKNSLLSHVDRGLMLGTEVAYSSVVYSHWQIPTNAFTLAMQKSVRQNTFTSYVWISVSVTEPWNVHSSFNIQRSTCIPISDLLCLKKFSLRKKYYSVLQTMLALPHQHPTHPQVITTWTIGVTGHGSTVSKTFTHSLPSQASKQAS